MELRILVILSSLSWATAEGRNREEFQAAVQQFPIADIQTLLLPLQEGSFLAAFSTDSNATGITRPCLDDIFEFIGDLRARKPSAVQGKVKELTDQSINQAVERSACKQPIKISQSINQAKNCVIIIRYFDSFFLCFGRCF